MDRRRSAIVTVGAALATLMAVGSALAADQTVTIAGFAFSPKTVTVNVGDTVTWTNNDTVTHTATSAGNFDTGSIGGGASKRVTFQKAGTFAYVCSIHSSMTGTVVVRAASGGSTGGSTSVSSSGSTTPPTDTVPSYGPGNDDSGLTVTLSILGLSLMAGVLIADRRFRPRS
jgi:plastocyanin